MDKLIFRKFSLDIVNFFLISSLSITFIIWIIQAVNFLDLIVDDGHGVWVYLNYSLLNVPKILTKFIPLSFFIALFITILKFEEENEFMILWTAGLNKINIVNFGLIFTFLKEKVGILLIRSIETKIVR